MGVRLVAVARDGTRTDITDHLYWFEENQVQAFDCLAVDGSRVEVVWPLVIPRCDQCQWWARRLDGAPLGEVYQDSVCEHPRDLMYRSAGERGLVWTKPAFGCVQFKAKQAVGDDVACEACEAGYRLSDHVHYDDAHGGETWGVCRKYVAECQRARDAKGGA